VAPEGLLIVPLADSLLTLPSPGPVIINGRFMAGNQVLAQQRCSVRVVGVNVEHAQRSEHERR
jgi:hypothetical protein